MSDILSQASEFAGQGMAYMQSMTVLITTIVIGLIIGLFGLKLSRVFAAFIGFVLGLAAGAGVVQVAGLTGAASVGAMLGVAVVFAILFCVFFKLGMFFFLIFMVAAFFMAVVGQESLLFFGIGLGIGLIIAILAIKAFDPIVIIATSASGGFSAGTAVTSLVGMTENQIARIAIPAAIILICAIVQFLLRSRQLGKKQAEMADEHKLKASRENEVEEARKLLEEDVDDEDYLDEDYDDDGEEGYLDEGDEDFLDEEDALENDSDFEIVK